MLLAMFAMVALTFVVMFVLCYARVKSVISGDVPNTYYRLVSGADVPDYVAKPSRHFANLFETPILFYSAGILCIALDFQTELTVAVAWLYVLFRAMHAVIHLTYNNVIHRMTVFIASCVCIFVLWLVLLFQM